MVLIFKIKMNIYIRIINVQPKIEGEVVAIETHVINSLTGRLRVFP